jgi:hypothetical protein
VTIGVDGVERNHILPKSGGWVVARRAKRKVYWLGLKCHVNDEYSMHVTDNWMEADHQVPPPVTTSCRQHLAGLSLHASSHLTTHTLFTEAYKSSA